MGGNKGRWLSVSSIIISLLALCISSFDLYYRIGDHTEVLVYEIRNNYLNVLFETEGMKINELNPTIYIENDFYLYNNSSFTVTIKNVEKYYENDDGRIFVEDIHPMKFFNNAILKPGDYVYHAELDFDVAEIPGADKYRKDVIDKIVEYVNNNLDKMDDCKKEKDKYCAIEGLSEYVLPLINSYTSAGQYKRIIYKITTSRNKIIWIKFDYLDDKINNSAN